MPILQVLSKQLAGPASTFTFLFHISYFYLYATPEKAGIEFTMVAEKMVDGGKNISIRGYLLMAQQALEQRDNNGFSLRI